MLSLYQRNSVTSLNKSISFLGFLLQGQQLVLCWIMLHSPWLYPAFMSLVLFSAIYWYVLFLAICNACICPIMIVYWCPQFISLVLQSPFYLAGLFFIPYPYANFYFIEYMFLLSSTAWISFEDFRNFLVLLVFFTLWDVLFVFCFALFLFLFNVFLFSCVLVLCGVFFDCSMLICYMVFVAFYFILVILGWLHSLYYCYRRCVTFIQFISIECLLCARHFSKC